MMALLCLLGGGFLFLLGGFYQRHWDHHLTATISFLQPSVYAGDQALLTETIENRKRFPVPVLEIGFRTEKGLSFPGAPNVLTSDYVYKRDIFSLLGMEKIVRRYTVDCEKRGKYHVSQLTLSSRFLLSGKITYDQGESQAELIVYPAKTSISSFLPAMESLMGDALSPRRLYEDPFSFMGIRPYTPLDPQRFINWKATAKTGDLMVNTYSSLIALEAGLYVDVIDPFIVKKDRLMEEIYSLALTLTEYVLRRGLPLGFYASAGEGGSFCLEAASSPVHLRKICTYLTQDFPTLPHTDYPLFLQKQKKERESLKRKKKAGTARASFFLSMNQEEDNYQAILDFLGKEEKGIWIVPLLPGEKLKHSSSYNLSILAARVS